MDHEDHVKFIEEDLIPEMVYDRRFCNEGSREFIDLKSVTVTNHELIRVPGPNGKFLCLQYIAKVVIEFSSEPKTFSVAINFLPKNRTSLEQIDRFKVDVYFYEKMLKYYTIDLFTKCYSSSIVKGERFIVLENLVDSGYSNETKSLNKKQVELCFRMMARFHAAGLKLNKDEPEIFQEIKQNLYRIELGSLESAKYDECIRL